MRFFIPAWLDDLGLSSTEFRVFCHICRRANGDGSCFATIKSMEEVCKIKRETISKTIKALCERGLVSKSGRQMQITQNAPKLDNSKGPEVAPKSDIAPKLVTNEESTLPPNPTSLAPKSDITCPQIGHIRKPSKETSQGKEEEDLFGNLPFPTVAFSAAWDAWETHRREIKKKLTPSTKKAQLKQLSKLKENEAIDTINASIEAGWTGLFPEKFIGKGSNASSRTRPVGATNEGRTFGRRSQQSTSGKLEDF